MKINETGERRASDVLFDELITSKNSLRRCNINALKRVCDLMDKDGVPITLAEVVRRSGEDGPKYSTVSNKGSSLGEYVRLKITEQAARVQKQGRSDVGRSVADYLQDPVLQARVRDTESEARYFKRENVALRGLLKNLRPGINIDQVMTAGPSMGGGLNLQIERVKESVLNPQLGAAILRLLDHLIGERQYAIYRGRLAINSKPVLSPQELETMRRSVGLSEADWTVRFQPAL